MDLTGRLDWFANRYVQYGVERAVPLAQPVRERLGGVQPAAAGRRRIGDSRSGGTTGSSSTCSTSLNFNVNYASNTAVIRGNAIDPLQNTQQITSSLNYSKRSRLGAR